MLKVNYVEDTRPVKAVTLTQPKGSLDLTLNKNYNGQRIRIANSDGSVVNVAVSELGEFKKALDLVASKGVKVSQRAA
jgi:hypothetical protein